MILSSELVTRSKSISKHIHDARSGKLLEMCYGFSQDNDLIFNSLKSVSVVFRPKRYKLFCPSVYLHREKLYRIHETKYLGCFLSDDQSDDVEISKQARTLYIQSNILF